MDFNEKRIGDSSISSRKISLGGGRYFLYSVYVRKEDCRLSSGNILFMLQIRPRFLMSAPMSQCLCC